MKFRTLRDIMYGSVSDPQTLIAGNEYDCADFREWEVKAWLENKWIEVVP